MENDVPASRVPEAEAPFSHSSPAMPTSYHLHGIVRWGTSLVALLAITAGGCTSPATPSLGPHGGLKRLNPLAAHSEKAAFEKEVANDPFPSADEAGIVAGVAQAK